MGDDTVYSGTVAAATEGFLFGIPSFAVSLAGKKGAHYDTAARVAADLIQHFIKAPFPKPVLLNINVPDLPYDQLRGTQITRLGKRHKAEPVIKGTNPRGETIYWVGAAGPAADSGEGTDFYAVENKMVSVTPLQIDLTHSAQIEPLRKWITS
jgi:5'-nucleotidase